MDTSRRPHTSLAFTVLLAGLALVLAAPTAEASHFRFGSIECEPLANPGEVECVVRQAWRGNSLGPFPAVGDIRFPGTPLNWGDGSSTAVSLTVTSISPAQNWFFGETTLTHTYNDPNQLYTLFFGSCCRIGGLGNSGSSFRVETVIDPLATNPRSSVPPIFGFPQSSTAGTPAVANFSATDPDGNPVECFLVPTSQTGGGSQPSGLVVNSDCTVEWDNASLGTGLFWTQIGIREVDGDGDPTGEESRYDFLLELSDQAVNRTPQCVFDPHMPAGGSSGVNASITVYEGQHLHAEIEATDLDGDPLELSPVPPLPPFGIFKDAADNQVIPPFVGPSPQIVFFHENPVPGGLAGNTYFVTMSVSDLDGNGNAKSTSQCVLTIDVVDPPSTDNEAPVCEAVSFEVNGGNYEIVSGATDNVGIVSATITRLTSNLDAYIDGNGPFAEGDVVPISPSQPSVDLLARFTSLSGSFAFLVTVADAAGNTAVCDPVITQIAGVLPNVTALGLSYPNPAAVGSATVRVPFTLAETADVRIAVYDALGREVAVLADDTMGPGAYEVDWPEAAALPVGTYIARLVAGTVVQTQRLVIVR